MRQDFRTFGPCGPAFDSAAYSFENIVQDEWHRAMKSGPVTDWSRPFREVVDSYVRADNLWLLSFLALEKFGETRNAVAAHWDRFRKMFRPELQPLHAFYEEPARTEVSRASEVVKIFLATKHGAFGQLISRITDPISYGPFTSKQLEYVQRWGQRPFDYGAGSGYTVQALRSLGLDARGYEPNAYVSLPGSASGSEGILDAMPWSEELLRNGHLLTGDEPALDPSSTLTISWPEPGAEFPARALERFRNAGGRRFLFKPGGFIGRRDDPRRPVEPGPLFGARIVRFFTELSTYWHVPDDAPTFEPNLFNNNLWAFERT